MTLPKLITVDVLAEDTNIPKERIVELTRLGYFPCYLLDNGEYRYHRPTAKDWIRENMLWKQDGKVLPVHFCVFKAPDTVPPAGLPKELEGFNTQMCRHYDEPECVYFLCRDGRVVYVGLTNSLTARTQQHRRERKRFDEVFYVHVPGGRELMAEVERWFIRQLKPELNLEPCVEEDNDGPCPGRVMEEPKEVMT